MGTSGSRLLVFLLFPPLAVGWNAILAIVFGRDATNISNTFFSANYFGPNGALVVGFALAALAISWWILYKDPVSIEWVNKFVASGLAVMAVVMLVLIFADRSWGEVFVAEPVQPLGDRTLDFMIAIELNLAAGFSWWSIMATSAGSRKPSAWPFGLTCLVSSRPGPWPRSWGS